MTSSYYEYMAKKTKTLTLRLPAEQHAELEAIARVDGKSVNQTTVEAIDSLIDLKRTDREFKKRLANHMAEHKAVLDRLSK